MATPLRADPRDLRAIGQRTLGQPHAAPHTVRPNASSPASQLLDQLVKIGLISQENQDGFTRFHGDRFAELDSAEKIGQALVTAGLLTNFQYQRALAGHFHGLVLGNYRLLDKIGGGSVGVVYLAEHMYLKRRVAMKVLPTDNGFPASVINRFYSEMRVQGQLNHPHIVTAYDSGLLLPLEAKGQTLHYLAMELLDGDLEEYVFENGPLPISQACEWMRQAAFGLQAAHDHHLIHRDLKPSNILRTDTNQIKLVDFGLAREFTSNRTEPRCLLGSVEFMPPEQSLEPSTVREPADVYGLGATLFWLLTGHTPYPRDENVADALRRLQVEPPRRLRHFLPDAPVELDDLIARMLSRNADQRPESAPAVMQALARFAAPSASRWETSVLEGAPAESAGSAPNVSVSRPWGVMILDDDPAVRKTLRTAIEALGCIVDEAEESMSAMEVINTKPIDLLLLDLNLPGIHGYEVCKALRAHPPRAHLKIVIASGDGAPNELTTALNHGADDFIGKPVPLSELA